ncbi:hypothetical protein OFD10_002435 [Shigella flexneri]|uniref:hypothetical protein n=1 Tax=Enterobacteriaceae TaxID=543 RepID=UPI0017554A6C|nr:MULTISPECIES: hypothetical protein [Enterobacteriaceae]EJL9013752.1 hypothetical protein [Escherichia coli]EJY9932390.1 hypothetical protein [Shigella flexneri]ELE9915460.1 hypothetical protein [Salmonella enterica]EMA6998320.1 hypothetical protein [Shigella sonnei]MDK9893773.1 hypothetical protein [Klebsiella pneumoniae]
MRINVDVFAKLLNVKPGEIVWAVNHGNKIDGMELPPSQRGIKNVRYKGPNSLTFEVTAAMNFAKEFNARKGKAGSRNLGTRKE